MHTMDHNQYLSIRCRSWNVGGSISQRLKNTCSGRLKCRDVIARLITSKSRVDDVSTWRRSVAACCCNQYNNSTSLIVGLPILHCQKSAIDRTVRFYPRDAMLARVLAVAMCLSVSVSQVGVLLKQLHESSWFLARELPSTYPTLS